MPGLSRAVSQPLSELSTKCSNSKLRVQQVGIGVRRRPDGRRRNRPHRPPRKARPAPWRVLPRPPRPHAEGLAAQKACALPMLSLLNFRCSFCSNPLGETHRPAPHGTPAHGAAQPSMSLRLRGLCARPSGRQISFVMLAGSSNEVDNGNHAGASH